MQGPKGQFEAQEGGLNSRSAPERALKGKKLRVRDRRLRPRPRLLCLKPSGPVPTLMRPSLEGQKLSSPQRLIKESRPLADSLKRKDDRCLRLGHGAITFCVKSSPFRSGFYGALKIRPFWSGRDAENIEPKHKSRHFAAFPVRGPESPSRLRRQGY